MVYEKFNYYWWKNKLTPLQVKQLSLFIEKNNDGDEPKTVFNSSKKNIKTKKIIHLSKIRQLSFFEKIINDILEVNNLHFGYDLFSPNNYGLYQCYDSKMKNNYDWHNDISSKLLSDIKLTVVINLSTKKYTGGDFQLHLNGEQSINQINESGNIILFKSILPHKVLPVINGERKTLTLFLEGPRFR